METSIKIENLKSKRSELLTRVQPLVDLKKKLYGNIDITTPKSTEEKNLEQMINTLFSQMNDINIEIRKLRN